MPIDSVQVNKDKTKIVKEWYMNLEPTKMDSKVTQINARTLINMDNEPMSF